VRAEGDHAGLLVPSRGFADILEPVKKGFDRSSTDAYMG
jgi:hypothetical protein